MLPKNEREVVKCPICDKRLFDIIKRPTDETIIELKCQRCRKIMQICIKNKVQHNG